MNSIWYSLAWKEWHEHKWKLVAITAVLWGVIALVLHLSNTEELLELSARFVIICMIPLAIFIGLGAAANERSRNTLPFLQALPMPMCRAALMKLVVGSLAVIAAIVLALGFLYLRTLIAAFTGTDFSAALREVTRDSFTGNWYFDYVLLGSAIATSFFVWAAASGVNRKDEVSAGAWALAVMAGWCLLIASCVYVIYQGHAPPRWLATLAVCTVPAGFLQLGDPDSGGYLPLGVGIALGTHLAMSAWYVRRFGRIEKLDVRSPQVAVRDTSHPEWLLAPRRSALTAIAWKQFRETAPIALVGVTVSVGFTLIAVLVDVFEGERWRAGELIGEVYPKMSVGAGMFIALVAGIGVCFTDMEPKLNAFWRSRPITPDGWFWCKYLTGLMVILTTVYAPVGVLWLCGLADFSTWTYPESLAIPVVQLAVFAAAVMTTCLVRHAVYAAILSVGVVYVGVLTGLELWYVAGLAGWVELPRYGWMEPVDHAPVVLGLTLSFFASTAIAWLAVRYDWGRKSRY